MVEPLPQLLDEHELRTRNVLDATYTCTDVLEDGGKARIWHGTDNQHRNVAVKVFFRYPGGEAFDEEVRIY